MAKDQGRGRARPSRGLPPQVRAENLSNPRAHAFHFLLPCPHTTPAREISSILAAPSGVGHPSPAAPDSGARPAPKKHAATNGSGGRGTLRDQRGTYREFQAPPS